MLWRGRVCVRSPVHVPNMRSNTAKGDARSGERGREAAGSREPGRGAAGRARERRAEENVELGASPSSQESATERTNSVNARLMCMEAKRYARMPLRILGSQIEIKFHVAHLFRRMKSTVSNVQMNFSCDADFFFVSARRACVLLCPFRSVPPAPSGTPPSVPFWTRITVSRVNGVRVREC